MIKSTNKQSGVSLIEVLVVLVLLLIGIFSVIRLFPPGFLINKQVGEQTAAGRLAKEEADRYVNMAANLMDAVVPVIPVPVGGGYQFRVDPGATPDDQTEADPTVFGTFAPYFSGPNKARRIMGESIRIPLPTTTTVGRGSIYMLSAGPFMDVPWNGGGGSSIFISGAPLIRRSVPPQDPADPTRLNPSDFLSNSSYAIDYGRKQIAFNKFTVPGGDTASDPREFTLTLSYYDSNQPGTPVVTLVDIVVSEPAGLDNWIDIPGLPSSNVELIPFSDTCSRKFKQISFGTAWSGVDPYQFYIDPNRSPKIGASNGVGANMGVIVFNPLGHDYTENSASGPVPLTAHIDYDVLDWHIIHEDRSMPSSTPYTVALALKDLKKLGDFEADQTTYDDIFFGVDRSAATAPFNTKADFIVYNVTTGDIVTPDNYSVGYRDGTVTFTDTFGQQNASGTFRCFYRANGDWALQIQKATGSYRSKNVPQPSYNEYYLGNGLAGGGTATRMYFPLSEAGKSISIRELYYQKTDGTRARVANKSFQINGNRTQFETGLTGGQPLTWIDLAAVDNQAARWDSTVTGTPVLGVQGISFRTRVIWRNGATVSTSNSGNVFQTRWRKVDLDTVLTRQNQ